MKPFNIAGNLYFVGTKSASSHIIATDCGLIMLDSGYPETLYLVMDSIRELGFSPYDLRYIIHSHGHIDHVGGTRALVELTGVKTAIGRLDKDYVNGTRDLTFAQELGMTFRTPFEPDILLDDGDSISLGGTVINCLHTPGHTEGTMSYFFNVSEGGNEYRVGTHGGVGTNSMEKEFLQRYGLPLSLRDDFSAGLTALRKQHVDIFIGNHQDQCDTIGKFERIIRGETNAFIDASAWGKFLDTCQARLYKLITEEQEL